MKRCIPVVIFGAFFVLFGCNRVSHMDAREQNNPLVAEASEHLDAGAYRAAGRLLREALDLHPTMARPHLDLAIIMHDYLEDYVRAIYHYHRYVELRPRTEKAAMIEQRITQARAALVSAYGGKVVDPAEVEQTAEALARLQAELQSKVEQLGIWEAAAAESLEAQQQERQELNVLRVTVAERDDQIETQYAQLQQLRAQVRRLQGDLEPAQSAVVATPRARTVGTSDQEENGHPVRTYEVRANDSLSAIAHRVYGDATKWRAIMDANREVLGDSQTLRIGQILTIPDLDDRR